MGKAHVTAIIQAIQETIENLSVNGCSSRAKITNPTVDSQYVENLEDGYGDDIQDIIDAIPDDPPAPSMPTVTKQQMGYVPWGSPGVTFLNGQSRALYYNGSTVSYNNNVLYSVRANSTNSQTEPDYYYNHAFTVISFNGSIGTFNGSGGDIYTEGCYLYTCASNSSSLVTVYNANNAEYYAFKYTTNGTDYYYVLDGTQDDWTDDLSSIGYSLTKNLPTVQNVQCWLAQNKGSTGMSPPSFTIRAFDENNDRIPYSSDLLYCVFVVASTPSADGDFEVANSTNTTVAIHRSDGTNYIDISSVFYASCSDKTATIIDVYDSQNNVFKAFKYTLDGVDYYRVMEWQNTHPDWVTDLSSIGYSLTPAEYNAYLDNQNKTITWNGWFPLYANAQKTATIPYDSGKTYTFIAAYTLSGTKVGTSHTIIIGRPDSSYSNLYILDQTSNLTAYRIEYTTT